MKKLGFGLLALVIAFSFGSCSTEEIEIPQESLLKSYEIKRDAAGHYSMSYDVADNTKSVVNKNFSSLTNEINLSQWAQAEKKSYTNDFSLENDNKLRIGILDENTGKRPFITIEDKNITFAKGEVNKDYLKSYGMKANDDGTFQLTFQVHSDVSTEFVYNEELNIHEVHLSRGVQTESKFSRTLEVDADGVLKMDFVNHYLGAGTTASGAEYTERHPRTIIVTD